MHDTVCECVRECHTNTSTNRQSESENKSTNKGMSERWRKQESRPSERGTRENKRGKQRQRAKDRERERERERDQTVSREREREHVAVRRRGTEMETQRGRRETGGCKGCLERWCRIAGVGACGNTRADTKVRVGSEPACPEAVLEGFGPSNTRRKAVLCGRSNRNNYGTANRRTHSAS